MVIWGKEVEAPPELIPERDTIEDDPAHDFGALPHMALLRPCPVFRIRHHPETEIALAVVYLVDDFDHAGIGAGHHFRPGGKRNSRNAVEENFDFPSDVEKWSIDAVSGHFNGFVETVR